MAVEERYLDPTAPGGGNGDPATPYNSITQWDANEATDLVADGDQHILYVRSGNYNGGFTLNQWGSSKANNITIKNDVGHHHGGVPGQGFVWESSANFATTLQVGQVGTVLEGFTLTHTATGGGGATLYILQNSDSCELRQLICGPTLSASGYGVRVRADTDMIEACLMYKTTSTSNRHGLYIENFYGATVRNCTIVNNADNGYLKNAGGPGVPMHNTVAFGSGGSDFVPTADTTGSHNASGDGTQPGTNGIGTIVAGDFADYANDDFSIDNTSALFDSGEAANRAAFDITGNPFTTNDIGAYAAVAAGPPDLALDWTVSGAAAVDWDIALETVADLPLDTTLPGAATIDWDLLTEVPLETTLVGIGTASAWNLIEEGAQLFPLATTLAGVGTALGWDAGIEFTMAATWLGGSSQDWAVATELSLATTLTGAGTIDLAAGLAEPLATTLAGAGTIAWSMEGQNGLVAQLNGVATAFDSDLGWEALLANTLSGAASINWSLVQEVPGDEALIATFVGAATTPGWSAIPELPLVASLLGVGTADAWNLSLDSDLTLATTLAGIGSASGWSAGLEQTLATTLPGVGTQVWDLAGDETLAVTLQGFATPDWYGSLDFPLFVTLPGITTVEDWSISRGGLDIPIFATAVRDVTPWPTVVDL